MLLVGARLKEEGRGEVARAAELLLQLALACRLHLGRLWRRRCRRLCCCCCRGRHRYRCRCGRGGGRRRNGRCRRLGCLRLLLLELLLMKLLLAPLLLPKLVALHPQSSERSLKPLNVGICRSVEPVVTILHEAFGLLLDQSTQIFSSLSSWPRGAPRPPPWLPRTAAGLAGQRTNPRALHGPPVTNLGGAWAVAAQTRPRYQTRWSTSRPRGRRLHHHAPWSRRASTCEARPGISDLARECVHRRYTGPPPMGSSRPAAPMLLRREDPAKKHPV